jgi:hypothetical protein
MSSSSGESTAIGFLSVRLHPELGYFGGYLVLNAIGRPLEFHCTLPVRASRAQEILFGNTLEDFICGEQIARALVAKAKFPSCFVVTDVRAVLSLRRVHSQPVVYVEAPAASTASSMSYPSGQTIPINTFACGENRVGVLAEFVEDKSNVQSHFERIAPKIDFTEPFGRIAEALLEAHPAAKAA